MAVVLDASAILAYWFREPGSAVVAQLISDEGALISTVNIAEALAKVDDMSPGFASTFPVPRDRDAAEAVVTNRGEQIEPGTLSIEAFTAGDAIISAKLRAASKTEGLSLGDRACLALARRLDLEAVTADRSWTQIADSAGVRVRQIR